MGRSSHASTTVPHNKERLKMTLNEEMKEAEEKGYKFIPPYKLNEMMKLSGKIVKILTDYNIPVTLCYDDMKIVLKMANCALEQGIQQKER